MMSRIERPHDWAWPRKICERCGRSIEADRIAPRNCLSEGEAKEQQEYKAHAQRAAELMARRK